MISGDVKGNLRVTAVSVGISCSEPLVQLAGSVSDNGTAVLIILHASEEPNAFSFVSTTTCSTQTKGIPMKSLVQRRADSQARMSGYKTPHSKTKKVSQRTD